MVSPNPTVVSFSLNPIHRVHKLGALLREHDLKLQIYIVEEFTYLSIYHPSIYFQMLKK